MKAVLRVHLAILIFLMCVFIKPDATVASTSPFFKNSEIIQKVIQYGYSLKNTKNKVLPKAEFWCYAPVATTAFQQLLSLETSRPYEMIEDDSGNQILHFTFLDIPPFSTKIIHIQSNMEFRSKPKSIPVTDPQHFLQPEEFIQSDHPAIIRLAGKLKGKNILQTVSNIFNWVAGEINYIGYLRNERGALYAFQQKKGDCTEFAALFVALCRANKIPARMIGGYICSANCILRAGEYHNWGEFYLDGTWRIADPQKKVFMKDESQYVAMKMIGNVPENQAIYFQRFRVVGDGLNVTMNR